MSQKVIRAEPRSDLELWVMGYNWCQLQIDHITRQREVHRDLIEALMGDADVVETEDGRSYTRTKEASRGKED